MFPYFIWNNIDSRQMGLWVKKYPNNIRAAERVTKITIPGAAGQLTLKESEDAYEPIKLVIQAQTIRGNNFDVLGEWLRGRGTLVLGNRDDKEYRGQIISEVNWEKVSNDLCEASIQIECEPFKRQYPNEAAIEMTSTGTVYNPGNVTAKPKITLTGTGNIVLTISSSSFTVKNVSGGAVLDSDARIATNADGTASIMENTVGEFLVLKPGNNDISWTGTVSKVKIEPGWRWH